MTYSNKMMTPDGTEHPKVFTDPDTDDSERSDEQIERSNEQVERSTDDAKGLRYCCKGTGPESCGQVVIRTPGIVVTRADT